MKPLQPLELMNIGSLSMILIFGLVNIFRPSSFYRSDNLTPDQIARKDRDWRWKGYFFATFAGALIVLILMMKFL
jgi:hypothetical protein